MQRYARPRERHQRAGRLDDIREARLLYDSLQAFDSLGHQSWIFGNGGGNHPIDMAAWPHRREEVANKGHYDKTGDVPSGGAHQNSIRLVGGGWINTCLLHSWKVYAASVSFPVVGERNRVKTKLWWRSLTDKATCNCVMIQPPPDLWVSHAAIDRPGVGRRNLELGCQS